MVREPSIIFHCDLVQDVAVLRPLMFLAKQLPGRRLEVLVSSNFHKLDTSGLWQRELSEICVGLDIPITMYESEFAAILHLQGKRGMLIAGSESEVKSHAVTHRLLHAVPSSFITVALQHGFECVGFLHNAAHDRAFGESVRFAADVIVGWFSKERLKSVAASEGSKLYIAGPPSLIDRPLTADFWNEPGRADFANEFGGIVCENLHSVRFKSMGLRNDFVENFSAFAKKIISMGGRVHLRPHPAGQFTVKRGVELPEGVEKSTDPLYRLDLTQFDYAVSAPSSVLFDFICAGVPTAVWIDPGGQVDGTNFRGLEIVSTLEDLWSFSLRASMERRDLRTLQTRFVEQQGIPADVRGRYARLMSAA